MSKPKRPSLCLVPEAGAQHTTETEGVVWRAREDGIVRPSLTIVHHPDWSYVGLRAVIGEKGALLGRSARACLPGAFDVSKVSREHAMVVVQDGAVVVQDMNSRNGTRVNGVQADQAKLAAGDVIAVGGVLLALTFGPPSFAEPQHASIVGYSWPIAKVLREAELVAASNHTVTLVGETGTGKELVARAMVDWCGRAGPLVTVNCGALAESLLEGELFGHVRGAFTGANAAREGLVAQAEGGTLFLDEVTSTPPRLQAVMLRLLEDGSYRPVGGNVERVANVRVIAAAQPDIVASMDAGRFRTDLWYRLSRRVIHLPTLDQRREDIPHLARHFARRVRLDAELTPALSMALMRAAWPGNARQLRNVMEAIAERSNESLLSDINDVPAAPSSRREGAGTTRGDATARVRMRRRKQTRPSRQVLTALMEEVGGRAVEAARRLNVDRKTVYRWLDALDIPRGG